MKNSTSECDFLWSAHCLVIDSFEGFSCFSEGPFGIFINASCAFLTRPHSRLANVSDRNPNASVQADGFKTWSQHEKE